MNTDLSKVTSEDLEALGIKKSKSTSEVLGIKPQNYGPADIQLMFITDTTGSMGMFIDEAKGQIVDILNFIQREQNLNIEVCFVSYKDHCDYGEVSKNYGWMYPGQFKELLKKISVYGGGDTPEAVFDGLNLAPSVNWTARARMIYLVGDAPAHGYCKVTENEFGMPICLDEYPEGCPCGLHLKEIAEKIKALKASFYAIALQKLAEECFREIALHCNGHFSSFKDAREAIRSQIIPQIQEAARLLLK